jgi:hypothetical protein
MRIGWASAQCRQWVESGHSANWGLMKEVQPSQSALFVGHSAEVVTRDPRGVQEKAASILREVGCLLA